MIKVFIADDHAIVRQGLKQILSETSDMQLIGEAADGQDTLQQARNAKWDVLILDITMPGRSGFDVLRILGKENPDLPVLVLSMHAESQFAVRCFRAGAAGYLAKESAPMELVKAIRQVVNGGKYVSQDLAEVLATRLDAASEHPLHETLSEREFQVLRMIGSGMTATGIADTLSLSVKTIATYRSRILIKLELNNTTEIIQYALKNRLVE